VDVPLDGSADVLRAVSGDYDDDGRIVADKGDTFILLVEWDAEGRLHSESIHQFGSATSRPESPHYDDQAPLFAEMQFKPVHFEEEDLAAHTSARYRPCETWTAGR
jgi:penicillin amidase/acyl-homoserine-lactone acylase